jgi:hypothetical protein
MPDVLYLSSYTLRESGIPTFTDDLTRSIDVLHVLKPASIIAVNETSSCYNYVSLFREMIQ